MKTNIKSCPFCGSKARTKGSKYNEMGAYGDSETEKQWFGVYCPNCNVNQPKRTYFSKQEAIDAWNTRV